MIDSGSVSGGITALAGGWRAVSFFFHFLFWTVAVCECPGCGYLRFFFFLLMGGFYTAVRVGFFCGCFWSRVGEKTICIAGVVLPLQEGTGLFPAVALAQKVSRLRPVLSQSGSALSATNRGMLLVM